MLLFFMECLDTEVATSPPINTNSLSHSLRHEPSDYQAAMHNNQTTVESSR